MGFVVIGPATLPAVLVAVAVWSVMLLGLWVIWDWAPYPLREVLREVGA